MFVQLSLFDNLVPTTVLSATETEMNPKELTFIYVWIHSFIHSFNTP
jgi:hypothetical protein